MQEWWVDNLKAAQEARRAKCVPVAPVRAAVLQALREDDRTLHWLAVELWGKRTDSGAASNGDVSRLKRRLGMVPYRCSRSGRPRTSTIIGVDLATHIVRTANADIIEAGL